VTAGNFPNFGGFPAELLKLRWRRRALRRTARFSAELVTGGLQQRRSARGSRFLAILPRPRPKKSRTSATNFQSLEWNPLRPANRVCRQQTKFAAEDPDPPKKESVNRRHGEIIGEKFVAQPEIKVFRRRVSLSLRLLWSALLPEGRRWTDGIGPLRLGCTSRSLFSGLPTSCPSGS
jgi:hypothetical protein